MQGKAPRTIIGSEAHDHTLLQPTWLEALSGLGAFLTMLQTNSHSSSREAEFGTIVLRREDYVGMGFT